MSTVSKKKVFIKENTLSLWKNFPGTCRGEDSELCGCWLYLKEKDYSGRASWWMVFKEGFGEDRNEQFLQRCFCKEIPVLQPCHEFSEFTCRWKLLWVSWELCTARERGAASTRVSNLSTKNDFFFSVWCLHQLWFDGVWKLLLLDASSRCFRSWSGICHQVAAWEKERLWIPPGKHRDLPSFPKYVIKLLWVFIVYESKMQQNTSGHRTSHRAETFYDCGKVTQWSVGIQGHFLGIWSLSLISSLCGGCKGRSELVHLALTQTGRWEVFCRWEIG